MVSLRSLRSTLAEHISVFADPRFWGFFGSALIVSVAYMDPGNFGTSISAGASFNYDLLWVVWLSSIMAMLLQYLSGKLGLAGMSLPELIERQWSDKRLVFAYWLLAELAILATDLAEFLGIAVALTLLFGIPLLHAALISLLDVFLLFFLTRKTFRPLEYAFISFVSIIGLGYVFELFLVRPNVGLIAVHSATPLLTGSTVFIAVGIIGATVMPHALFVHSWLMKNKMKGEMKNIGLPLAKRFHFIDTVGSLFVAGFINAAILIMAAAAFYHGSSGVATINAAYRTLQPLFGPLAATVFAITLLFSGISSSITGTLAGQSIMESLTPFRLDPWVRRIITRVINIIPLSIAILLHLDPLSILVYSQVILSFLIPLPMLPLIYYTAKRSVMGTLANTRATTFFASLFALIIISLNVYLIAQFFGFIR